MKKSSQDKYFALAKKIDFTQKGSRQDKLLDLLKEMEKSADEGYRCFFQGEKAFLNQAYKEALKLYLLAKGVENIQFYCHRCHAFLYAEMQRYKESLHALKKAMQHFQDDQSCLSLFHNLKKQLSSSPPTPSYPSVPLESLKHSDFLKNFQPSTESFALQQPQDLFLSEGEVETFDQSFSLFKRLSSEEENLQWEDPLSQEDFLEENELWEEDYKAMFSWEELPSSSYKDAKRETTASTFPWEVPQKVALEEVFANEKAMFKHYAQDSCSSFQNQMMFCPHAPDTPSSKEMNQQLAQSLNPSLAHEGFFLRWEGCGIAYNPSFHFLQNLAEAKLNLLDINHIFFDPQRPILAEYVEKLSLLHQSLRSYRPQAPSLKIHPLSKSFPPSQVPFIEAIELSPHLKAYLSSPTSFQSLKMQFFHANKEKHLQWAWINMQALPQASDAFFEGCQGFIYDFSLLKLNKQEAESQFIQLLNTWMRAHPHAYHLLYGHHPIVSPHPFRALKQLREENNQRLLPFVPHARLDIHSLQLQCHYSQQFFSWEDTHLLTLPFPEENAVFLGKPLFI